MKALVGRIRDLKVGHGGKCCADSKNLLAGRGTAHTPTPVLLGRLRLKSRRGGHVARFNISYKRLGESGSSISEHAGAIQTVAGPTPDCAYGSPLQMKAGDRDGADADEQVGFRSIGLLESAVFARFNHGTVLVGIHMRAPLINMSSAGGSSSGTSVERQTCNPRALRATPHSRRWYAAGLLILALNALATPARAAWIGSWGAAPAPPITAADADVRALTPRFEDQTLVQVVRLSAGGSRLRLRITNEYGEAPLTLGAIQVSLINPDGSEGARRGVTFGDSPRVVIPAGAPALSDAVDLAAPPLARLRISLHVSGRALCTCHVAGGERLQVSPPGDHTDRPFQSVAPTGASYRAFISAVEVDATSPGPVIVAFGDSITDGLASTIGTNRRWPDRLADRLAARPGPPAAVVNAGISGNRLLADGYRPAAGESALKRFDRDVLAVSGVTHLLLLEGVNDLGFGGAQPPDAAQLIFGYRQLIARAHAHGIRVIGGTILPYGRGVYFRSEGEAVRQAVNAWIRTSGAFDGVIDFDAAMRDPAAPSQLRADFHSGDWIHPNDAGYEAMAAAIDLDLLR